MKEIPNPLQSLNSIGAGITTKIADKLTSKFSEIQKLNKFVNSNDLVVLLNQKYKKFL